MHVVKPLPQYERFRPYSLVGYNGYKQPMAMIANPEDLFFMNRRDSSPSTSLWIIPSLDNLKD